MPFQWRPRQSMRTCIFPPPRTTGTYAGVAPSTSARHSSTSARWRFRSRYRGKWKAPGSTRAREGKEPFCPLSSRGQASFLQDRLEELDRIAGRVLDDDLLAAHTGDDFVPERSAGGTESADGGGEIVDLNSKTIPAPWGLHGSVGHGLPPAGRWIRRAED